MKQASRRIAALAAAVICLLAIIAPMATAEALPDDIAPFLDEWECGDVTAALRYDAAEDAVVCRIARDAEGGTQVWEYGAGWYDGQMGALVCAGCVRYTQRVDIETRRLVEDDWSMDDMECAWFTLSEDGGRLTGVDIAGMDAPLELRRRIKDDTERPEDQGG